MTINFTFGFRSNGHFGTKTIILLSSLTTMFLILTQLLALASVLGSPYGKEHYYDPRTNFSNLDLMYDSKSQIFGKSYKDWTAEWWKWAYSIPVNENPAYDDYGINCSNS